MQTRLMFTMIVCLGALGCRDATAPANAATDVTVRTERTTYRPVDLVVITTINPTGATVYDDHCGGAVEGYEFLKRWNGSYGAGRGCVDVDLIQWRSHSVAIPPGATHVDTMHVNSQSYTGTWRVALILRDEFGGALSDAQRISNSFHVDGTWTP